MTDAQEILDMDDEPDGSGIHLTPEQRLPLLEAALAEARGLAKSHERISNERAVELTRLQSALDTARRERETLFDAIKHGDDEHRAWLKVAIDDHFAGRPVQKPKGKSRSEQLHMQLDAAIAERDEARREGERVKREKSGLIVQLAEKRDKCRTYHIHVSEYDELVANRDVLQQRLAAAEAVVEAARSVYISAEQFRNAGFVPSGHTTLGEAILAYDALARAPEAGV